jgi:small subunit ribosomal protein S7
MIEKSEKPVKKEKKENSMVFGKWSTAEIKVEDIGLVKYIGFESKKFPHSFGKSTRKRFQKGKMSIVERLINKVMRSGQGRRKLSGKYIRGRGSCGKKLQAMKIVENAFELIEKETKQNPIQLLVKAIENVSPREDITRIKRGGISYTISVDVAPLKRIDEALKNIALAAFQGSFKKKVSAEEALAKEIVLASKGDNASFAVKRKDEIERIAIASR